MALDFATKNLPLHLSLPSSNVHRRHFNFHNISIAALVIFALPGFDAVSSSKSVCLVDLQDEADDSDAPHVRLQANGFIVDHLRGHELRCAMHHHQGIIVLLKKRTNVQKTFGGITSNACSRYRF